VSVVEINQPTASVSEQTGDHPSKSWLETLQENGRMTNDDALVKDLNAYVRNSLFPKLKFIMGKQQMSYSPEGNNYMWEDMQQRRYDRPEVSGFVVGTLQGYDRRHFKL
jgi:hypothetical protein